MSGLPPSGTFIVSSIPAGHRSLQARKASTSRPLEECGLVSIDIPHCLHCCCSYWFTHLVCSSIVTGQRSCSLETSIALWLAKRSRRGGPWHRLPLEHTQPTSYTFSSAYPCARGARHLHWRTPQPSLALLEDNRPESMNSAEMVKSRYTRLQKLKLQSA